MTILYDCYILFAQTAFVDTQKNLDYIQHQATMDEEDLTVSEPSYSCPSIHHHAMPTEMAVTENKKSPHTIGEMVKKSVKKSSVSAGAGGMPLIVKDTQDDEKADT